jgi:transposase
MKKQKICCGLDVHKDIIFASIYNKNGYGEVKEFNTMTFSIRALCDWLKSQGVTKIAMESTGIYWIPIWNIMEEYDFELLLVNPYLIKQMPGRKSDVKDAQWISQLLFKDMLRGSLIPSQSIRTLRQYSRAYVKKQQAITRVVQGLERILETANIRLTSIVSRIESKSVLDIVDLIIAGETNPDILITKVHTRIKNSKAEKVRQSLEGNIQKEHQFLLKQKMEEYRLLHKQSDELEKEMMAICKEQFEQEMDLLKTMPGVGDIAAVQIIAETGCNMDAFETSNKLAKWCGLCPRNDESAGKIKSKATTKGSKHLRAIMVQTAWAGSRTKESYFQTKFQHLVVRKGSKKALIAIARKQLTVIWNMLKYKEKYDKDKQPVLSIEQLKAKKKYLEKELNKLSFLEEKQ